MTKSWTMPLCFAGVLALAVLNGCAGSWYWPEGDPVHASWQDSTRSMSGFQTFTIVPYSALKNDSPLKPEEENALMFALMCGIEQQGYRYVDRMDSADFVVTEDISTRYAKGEDLALELSSIPSLRAATSFAAQSFGFGTYYDVPMPIAWRPASNRAHIKLNAIVYDGKSHAPIRHWVEGVISADTNYLVGSQYLIADFSRSLDSVAITPAEDDPGFRWRIWTYDMENFWPIVGRPSRAAREAGLKEMDALLSMDGKSLKNIDAEEFRQRIRHKVGKTFDLRVWRQGQKLLSIRIATPSR